MSNSLFKNAAYSVLDAVTLKRGIARQINNFKVRFPPRWMRYFPGDYEADNYAFLEQQVKTGMHIIDIGAHIGLFSVCTSQLTGPKGKIISFEPTPGTFTILKDTLRLNHCDNVIALQAAVGSTPDKAIFYVSNVAEGCNSNSLVSHRNKKETENYEVSITTIDIICDEHNIKPDLVKIDVEGAELDVLKGSMHTLKTIRPLVILGLHPAFIIMKGDSLKGIWNLIQDNKYKIFYNGSEMKENDFITQANLFDVHLIPIK